MKPTFAKSTQQLREASYRFDDHSLLAKKSLIGHLSKMKLPVNEVLVEYVDVLLFILAHPDDKAMMHFVEKELRRISTELKKLMPAKKKSFVNSGLPWMHIHTRFSHDCITWMLERNDINLEIESYTEPSLHLIDALKITLPAVEREYTTTGMENDELMDELLIDKSQRLSFIADQLNTLNHVPIVKDFIFDGLDIHVDVKPTSTKFSKIYNRIVRDDIFYHNDILKKFDHVALLNSELPQPVVMSGSERNACVDALKIMMTLNARETDPTTFMDESSLRLYDLERGISVAIYGMTPSRQLPTESYVGFTLFKNGLPASYGGGWVFGRRSLFGINILEAFRGGESGYVMCQILRVYRQAFGVDYFEVEPYQYGADNADGIKSGAFWFYYRYGFRPLEKTLFNLAERESKKIQSTKGYRTGEKTLLRFTESNIALNLGKTIPPTVSDLVLDITALIKKKYKGDRALAQKECIRLFLNAAKIQMPDNLDELRVLSEVSFLYAVLSKKQQNNILLLKEMITTKPNDLYGYQQLLLKLF